MIRIRNESNRPQVNLAIEEYALKELFHGEDILILWQNEPSIIIGRHQNTLEEINQSFVKEKEINVVRRLSGGGAVYHDFGNLNFTYIKATNENRLASFQTFTKPIIKALQELGVDASFQGRNDLVIGEKKFSGNAQYYYGNRLLHHGTILFNSNIEDVVNSLNVSEEKISSKSIKSVRSRVTNICDHLEQEMSMDEFKEHLIKTYEAMEAMRTVELTQKDIAAIKDLSNRRYNTWEWNYAKSPAYDLKKEKRHPGGKLEILLHIQSGKIKKIVCYGDFFASEKIDELLEKFIGLDYRKDVITVFVQHQNWEEYFVSITQEEFLDTLFGE